MVAAKVLERSLIGPAGEHYCLYQLLRRGFLATMGPPATPEVDILILSPDAVSTVATVQVKTRTTGADGGWHMRKKHEEIKSLRLLYTFVDLEPAVPVVYVVPARRVAEVVRQEHEMWLATPGAKGQQHRDHDMRRLLPNYRYSVPAAPPGWLEEYRDRWDLVGQETGNQV